MIIAKKWSAVLLALLISGCNTLPSAQGDSQLTPTVPPSLHELSFNVRSGLQATVSLSETRIVVRVNNGKPVKVSSVNLPLLREWSSIYLKVGDYDQDGLNDLAVLKTAGRGGDNRCYAIYRYNPQTGQFRDRKSFDRCNI